MRTVLLATEKPFANAAVEGITSLFKEAGYEIRILEKYSGKGAFKDAVSDVDAIIVRSDLVDNEIIEASGKLKIVVRAGAGYDNIDLAGCSKKGIVVMNTPGQNSNAVAELVLGMMIFHLRNHFNGETGTELRGKTIGLHGYGNVGKYVALLAKGLGMTVYAFDPFLDPSVLEKEGIKSVTSMNELYKVCQFVSLHIPLTNKTHEVVNDSLLSLMPEGAVLINTARKEVVHEPSLLGMFESRPDFSYISDVVPGCTLQIEIRYPGRFFFTPKKMGAQTAEANNNAGLAAAREIINFFEKGDISCKVN